MNFKLITVNYIKHIRCAYEPVLKVSGNKFAYCCVSSYKSFIFGAITFSSISKEQRKLKKRFK